MQVVKKVKPFHIDKRGEMSYVLDDVAHIKSVLYITCKKGSIRANHYHKNDMHYSYMIKGEMEYYYRDLNSENNKLYKVVVREGDIVRTPPMIVHAMRFTKDSSFIALTTESRNQVKYERDTVRVKLIP